MRLQGKSTVITGAASGMGKAMAILFAREGASVVVADVNAAAIEAVVAEIAAAGGQAVGVPTDVTKEDDIARMIDTAVEKFGTLDILVNNAGIMDNFAAAGNVTDELWNRVLDVNLTGPMRATRKALGVMTANGKGVIVNIASVGGLFGSRAGAAYTAAKHGIVGLTKNVGFQYAKLGIRCNAIAPGGVATNIGSTITQPDPLGMGAANDGFALIRGDAADPQRIAEVALFLASDESSFVNGTVVTADGGWTAY